MISSSKGGNLKDLDGEGRFNYEPSSINLNLLKEGNFLCNLCGLQSSPSRVVPSGFMEVIDNKIFCLFCSCSQFIGRSISGHREHGRLIWCPELSQGDINRCIHYCYLSIFRDNKYSEGANKIKRALLEKTAELSHLGTPFETGSLQNACSILDNISPEAELKLDSVLDGLRYIPIYDVFLYQIKYWDQTAFRDFSDSEWDSILC